MDVILTIIILLWIIGIYRKKKGKEGFLKRIFFGIWDFVLRLLKRSIRALLYLIKQFLAFMGYFLLKFLKWLAWFIIAMIKFLFQAIAMFFRSLSER